MTRHAASTRQLLIGVIAVPLSLLPFVLYMTLTPEGRLVRDRALVAISPPTLPELTAEEKANYEAAAPSYDNGVMVLAYHGIGSADAEGGFVVSAERFGEHLVAMRAAGVNFVTATQVAESFEAGKTLPHNAVMVTFDDGRADAMMFADPLLEQADAAATMFLITSAASEPGVYYAGWDDIETFAKSGRWDIQSHTANLHREWEVEGGGYLPALTSLSSGESIEAYRERVRADLSRAVSAIEAHTGTRPVAFAYPFGAYGADRTNDHQLAEVLREEVARYHSLGFQQDDQHTVPLATCGSDLLLLRRLEVEDWSGEELLHEINSSAQRTRKIESKADCGTAGS